MYIPLQSAATVQLSSFYVLYDLSIITVALPHSVTVLLPYPSLYTVGNCDALSLACTTTSTCDSSASHQDSLWSGQFWTRATDALTDSL